MRERQHRHGPRTRATPIARRGVAAAVLSAVALSCTPAGASTAPHDALASRASDAKVQRAAARKRAARHAPERKRLRLALARNPRRALKGSFLRRAAIVGLKMPVTVRLRAGTRLGVTWAPTRFPFDDTRFPAAAGEQELDLAGNFPMVIDFAAGPGYGGPGNLQGRSGPGGAITAAGPLVIAEPAGCAGVPPAFVEAATSTTAGAPIAASAAVQTWVDLNPFSGLSDGYLDLKLSVRSRVLGSATTCASAPTEPSADYDVPVTSEPADRWNAPVRIRWDGRFRIAPAITDDGAIRFGKISVDGAVQPQNPTTGNLWGCAAEPAITGAGLPLSATPCTLASGSALADTVGPAPFPATLIVKTLSADILLGDRN